MVKLIMLGPPGAGKGTYATRLAPKLGIPTISMGDVFREEVAKGTELGKKVKEYMDKGELVPDEIVIETLKNKLKELPDGYILDGFPRTLAQAKALDEIEKIDAVIYIDVSDEIVIKRLSSRRICKKCGAIYNLLYLKPKVDGICDKCGGELYQREDDKPEAIKERLKVYYEKTAPLIDYYEKQRKIIKIKTESIDVPPEEQVEKIIEALKERKII